jgi:hypothetical protein
LPTSFSSFPLLLLLTLFYRSTWPL